MRWNLRTPSEWIAATNDPTVSQEYAQPEYLVEQVNSAFHALLVAQRSLWLTKTPEEVVATAQLATRLSPGCARGRPLRLLAEHGVDTKFFERNASLLTKLLDERFEGAASEQGLTTFLDAFEESNHWVLVVPLQSELLPFKRLRITTSELAETPNFPVRGCSWWEMSNACTCCPKPCRTLWLCWAQALICSGWRLGTWPGSTSFTGEI